MLLTLAAYARVWSFDLVYDDANWLPMLIGATWSRAPFALANWAGGGLPWAFHGLIVALHLANGGLLWVIARRWLSPMACLLMLTLFWLHPLQVEAVAYVSGGLEVLLTTYVLLALWGVASGRWWGCLLAGLAFYLAVDLKPSAWALLLLPLVWLIARRPSRVWLLTAFASMALLAWWVLPFATVEGWYHAPWSVQAQTQWALMLWRGLACIVWPVGFSIEHDWVGWPALVGVYAVSMLALMVTVAWDVRTRWAAPWWACVWIVALVAPRALVPNAPPLTEHHLYAPFLAIWALAGATVDRVTKEPTCLISTI